MTKHSALRALPALGIVLALFIWSCPSSNGDGTKAETGGILGHARYSGQADNAGIVVSAESVDGAGKTASVARALVAGRAAGTRALAAQATTDSSGAYALSGLAPGTYTVYASSKDSLEKAVTTGAIVVAGKDVTASDLNLTPTGGIAGKATLNGASTGNLGIMVFVAGTSYAAMTDDSGAYTVSDVPAGAGYALVASKPGYDSVTVGVTVNAGATTAVTDMNLKIPSTTPTTGSVSGAALLNGNLAGNAGIIVFLAGTSDLAMTGDDGSFAITGVQPGSYTLTASKEGYAPASSSETIAAGINTNAGALSLAPVLQQVSTPAMSPSTGSYTSAQTVTITDATPGASIYYTTDGSTPTASSAAYSAPFVVSTVGATVVQAIATKTGLTTSAVAQAVLTILGVVAEPTFSVAGSTIIRTVSMSCTTPGSTIHYTTDGSTPTASSPVYATPIVFGGCVGMSETVSAIAVASGMANSQQSTTTVSTGSISALSLSAIVTTLAGSTTAGHSNGVGNAASFSSPNQVACDGTNLYVADATNNEIRKIVIASGTVTTLAGSTTSGHADGTGSSASFSGPEGVTADGANLYIADTSNNEIRKVAIATGVVTTLAGSTASGHADGVGAAASFFNPEGIATDGVNLYVADTTNHDIRKIVIATGVVTTLAGTGAPGHADGIGSAASFTGPKGICTDGINLYVGDWGNNEIRKVVIVTGAVSTLAGSTTAGHADGTGPAASFYWPAGTATDGSYVYIADQYYCLVRKVAIATGVVTTLAGSDTGGHADGTGVAATFSMPWGIATDGYSIFVGDASNNEVRQMR